MKVTRKSRGRENIVEIGWYGDMNNFLWHVAPNGLLKIKNCSTMARYYLKMEKTYLRMMAEQLNKIALLTQDYSIKLMVKNKLQPYELNECIQNHPIVLHRLETERSIKLNKKKPKKPYTHPCIKKLEKIQFENIQPEVERWGIIFRESKFGECFIVDYYKHGRLLKQKIKEHNKETGLHLRRSNFQVKLNNENVEKLTTIQDLNIFHEMANKLIKERFCGRY